MCSIADFSLIGRISLWGEQQGIHIQHETESPLYTGQQMKYRYTLL